MTATHSAPLGFPHNLLAMLKRLGQLAMKGLLAFVIVMMAGVVAFATAVAGLALAAVAIIIGMFGRRREDTNIQQHADGQGITLEARKTPRGWTVE